MKLTKILEKEIKALMDDYWDSYLRGDMKHWRHYLVDDYRNIGGTEEEVWNSKKEILDYTKRVIDQMIGMAEIRNKKTQIIPYDPYIMVHEFMDLFIKVEGKWTFYGKFRLSSLIKKIDGEWKVLHQHGSYPDSHTEQGEAFAFDKIRKENTQLREAVKRRTIELEEKNNELKIETALERVRSVAMSMKDPSGMLKICKAISQQLKQLGVKEIRNVQTAIFYEDKGTYMNYEYYAKHNKTFITDVSYTNHKIHKAFAAKMLKGKGEFFATHIKGKKVKEWIAYQKTTNVFIDKYLQKASSVNYYWHSLGPVALGMSTYRPLSAREKNLFNRFVNVFELAYRRYLDIEKAETQAREAEIQLALERVRARSLAMHHTSELQEVVNVVAQQLHSMNIDINGGVFITINEEVGDDISLWASGGMADYVQKVSVPFHNEPVFTSLWNAIKKRNNFFTETHSYEEKVRLFKHLFKFPPWNSLSKKRKQELLSRQGGYTRSVAVSNYTSISITNHNGKIFSEEENEVLKRFGNVFEQSYIRFLDLQKAEAQAREAQIEVSLERVRSRAIAMHKSDELLEVGELLYREITKLGIECLTSGYVLMDEKENIGWNYTASPADGKIMSKPVGIYHMETDVMRSVTASWKKGDPYSIIQLDPEATIRHQTFIAERSINFPLTAKELIAISPERIVLHNFNFKHGYLLIVGGKLLNAEQLEMMVRFSKVFEMTYRRFLDLKQAEAQAREAQIEAALEKVRSGTMAMQKSEDLNKAASDMFRQIQTLGMQPWACGFNIFDNDEKAVTQYMSLADGGISPPFRTPLTEDPFFISIYEARQRSEELLVMESSGDSLAATYRYMFGLPGSGEIFGDLESSGFEMPKFQVTHCAYFSQGYLVFITYEHVPEAHDIFKRFAKVFEQTYTRFLDLQKAEAQARESQIQLALERVRARTMAMHKSDELPETSHILFEQMKELGEPVEQLTIGIIDEENKVVEISATLLGDTLKKIYRHSIDEPYIMNKIYKAWKKQQKTLVVELSGDELNAYNKYRNELTNSEMFPTNLGEERRRIVYAAFFSKGMLALGANETRPAESLQLLVKFASVFDLTYTRFLDLQKAEAQAREAQIETSLERVRSKTMAMHNSNDVGETVIAMFAEFEHLGIHTNRCGILIFIDENSSEVWTARSNPEGKASLIIGRLNLKTHRLLSSVHEAWMTKNSFYQYDLLGDDLTRYYEAINNSEFYKTRFDMNALPSKEFHSDFFFTEGAVFTFSKEPIAEEHSKIIKRFAGVFGQTYRRYLDLQKAEANAREAKIEAAMEKVRARAMAMQKPNELVEVAQLLRKEMGLLGVEELETSSIYIHNNETGKTECWYSIKDENKSVSDHMTIDLNDSWVGRQMLSFYQSDKKQISIVMKGDERKEWINYCADHSKELTGFYGDTIPDRTYHLYKFSNGYMGAASPGDISAESWNLLQRATNVFSLAYTRFSDLQLAEAQAREATIEAALERVRGKAMAMHNSKDLSAAASMVFTELRKLGISPIRCGVGLLNKESKKAQLYSATSSVNGDSLSLVGWVQLENHPVLEKIYDSWGQQYDYFPELQGEQLQSYYQLLLQGLSVRVPDFTSEQKQYGHFIPFSIGCLYAWSDAPYNEAEIKIFKRFASIIDLTFRRYLDLQQSETSAKEAIKQAALDRIRADIASMRTISDLDRITPLIWNELTILGIPFIRCGVFIMDDAQQLIHTFLSTPDGKAIAAFHLPYDTPGNIGKVLSHWRERKDYIDHWDETVFTEFADTLVRQGALTSSDQYLKTIPHGGFYLHFLPFLQGMLYAGNSTQLGEEDLKLLQSVADAFSTAYARYEDFNKLEAAKKQVDSTLNELQATQKQLIQSEKMASLGELTAGIAHEIQNPLNFVNNFSDVSNELIDEMMEEVAKGNLDEAKAIADDVKQNLEKINHHGKRADSIVKGMLQHSRSSSGQKEPTDINALCDEYLRLAYHGLRAKDKSFNAKFETHFDPSVGKIEVMPQDMGRVILNLINNAFYAVSETKTLRQAQGDSFEPTVTVSTKKYNGKVEIRVADNGSGIPQKVLDKIFQPFFTTKPTGQGTGLGLSLSYDIVKAHGGELKVETEEGEGTTFIVQIPIN